MVVLLSAISNSLMVYIRHFISKKWIHKKRETKIGFSFFMSISYVCYFTIIIVIEVASEMTETQNDGVKMVFPFTVD